MVGTVTLGASTNLSATAEGGDANVGYGGDGGYALGGMAWIEADTYPGTPE